ncbi:hypothetical protein CPC08DRAFT_705158 [Agrocybe pediades]|nr:hypothetical protein CPC08DRAFT_705158 [Agrocybe pediades]
MPLNKRPKDAKPLRQTTLFQSALSTQARSSSPGPSTPKRPLPSVAKRKHLKDSSSEDELSSIKLAPKTETLVSSDDDDDVPLRTPSKRKIRKIRISDSSSEEEPAEKSTSISTVQEDEDEDEPPVPRRRRLRRKPSVERSSDPDSTQDMADLADEVDEDKILDSRLRTRKKSSFQANLEKLRRRKLKIQDDEDHSETEDDECYDSGEVDAKPFKGAKASIDIGDLFDGEQSDSGNSSAFIVEDGDDTVQLPAEFSMETHQDLSHQFKKIFQFFVHVAVQSPKKRAKFMQSQMEGEEYFSVPLQVTRRKLLGLRDSLVASSVWRPEFKKSLERSPDFELIQLEFAVPSCDACHLGGRMSTLLGRLTGTSYNRLGFKKNESRKKEKENAVEFHLGRFCARRTKVYHDFSHWEYSLFNNILREIDGLRDAQSSTGFRTVAFYGGIEPPENLDDADGICEWLDQRQVVEMEWQNLKNMMESARHLELGAKRGEADE